MKRIELVDVIKMRDEIQDASMIDVNTKLRNEVSASEKKTLIDANVACELAWSIMEDLGTESFEIEKALAYMFYAGRGITAKESVITQELIEASSTTKPIS